MWSDVWSCLIYSIIITTVLYLSDALRKNFLSDKFDYKVCPPSASVWIHQKSITVDLFIFSVAQPLNRLRFHVGVGFILLPVCYLHQPALPSARDLLCIKEEENPRKVSACNFSEFWYFSTIYSSIPKVVRQMNSMSEFIRLLWVWIF